MLRHRDLGAIYKDMTHFSSDKKVNSHQSKRVRCCEHHTTSLVFNDPPLHVRVRDLIAGALNPRRSPRRSQVWWLSSIGI
jgi:hypothetical protein